MIPCPICNNDLKCIGFGNFRFRCSDCNIYYYLFSSQQRDENKFLQEENQFLREALQKCGERELSLHSQLDDLDKLRVRDQIEFFREKKQWIDENDELRKSTAKYKPIFPRIKVDK